MANPRSIGKVYWHPLIYPVKPPVLWERAETQEIVEPYRAGAGVSLRLPFTRLALVLGIWTRSYDEGQALTNAIRGRAMASEEVDWDFVRTGVEDEIV